MICFESVKFDDMQNISEELISFDLELNEVNSLVCTNKNTTKQIFEILIGLRKTTEGYVFIEGYDIFSKRTRDMYSLIDDNIAYVNGEVTNFQSRVIDFIYEWTSLNDIKDKLAINKLIAENQINEFEQTPLFNLTINQYTNLISFLMRIAHKKNFIIYDFFNYIGSEIEASQFIKRIKELAKKEQVTIFLIGFNFFDKKNINYIKLTHGSKNCKYKKELIIEDKEFKKIKKDKMLPKQFNKFILYKNWKWIIASILMNFFLFSLAFFTSSLFNKYGSQEKPLEMAITLSLLSLQFFLNGILTLRIFNVNKKYISNLLLHNRRILWTWIFLSISILWSWQLLGILLSLIPLYVTNALSNKIVINNNFLISFIFVEISSSILISILALLWYLKDIYRKEKIVL